MPSPEVTHLLSEQRFEIHTPEGVARLDYLRRPDALAITHTFVPEGLRSRGLAELLMRAAIDLAAREQLPIDPVCSYAARFLERTRNRA